MSDRPLGTPQVGRSTAGQAHQGLRFFSRSSTVSSASVRPVRGLRAGWAAGALAAFAIGDAPAVRAQSLTCSTDTDSDNGLLRKAAIAAGWCRLRSPATRPRVSRQVQALSPGGVGTTRVGEHAAVLCAGGRALELGRTDSRRRHVTGGMMLSVCGCVYCNSCCSITPLFPAAPAAGRCSRGQRSCPCFLLWPGPPPRPAQCSGTGRTPAECPSPCGCRSVSLPG